MENTSFWTIYFIQLGVLQKIFYTTCCVKQDVVYNHFVQHVLHNMLYTTGGSPQHVLHNVFYKTCFIQQGVVYNSFILHGVVYNCFIQQGVVYNYFMLISCCIQHVLHNMFYTTCFTQHVLYNRVLYTTVLYNRVLYTTILCQYMLYTTCFIQFSIGCCIQHVLQNCGRICIQHVMKMFCKTALLKFFTGISQKYFRAKIRL